LHAALEEGLSQVEDLAGRFPQLAGAKLVFDASRPKGSRIVEVSVGGKPLDPRATYKLATNEYVAGGGDGYASLKKGRSVIDASAATLMANVVMDYIAAKGTVAPTVEGRIVEKK
jgi:2',3'-cyclic-nucleotide 2'-phosphodiesterase (5'-nucleotidase family)